MEETHEHPPDAPPESVPEAVIEETASVPEESSTLANAWQEDFSRRLDELQAAIVDLSQRGTGYAPHDHQHPLDPAMATLAEALAEEDRIEQAPERRRWWERKITLHGIE